jgi:hypothetical protein
MASAAVGDFGQRLNGTLAELNINNNYSNDNKPYLAGTAVTATVLTAGTITALSLDETHRSITVSNSSSAQGYIRVKVPTLSATTVPSTSLILSVSITNAASSPTFFEILAADGSTNIMSFLTVASCDHVGDLQLIGMWTGAAAVWRVVGSLHNKTGTTNVLVNSTRP